MSLSPAPSTASENPDALSLVEARIERISNAIPSGQVIDFMQDSSRIQAFHSKGAFVIRIYNEQHHGTKLVITPDQKSFFPPANKNRQGVTHRHFHTEISRIFSSGQADYLTMPGQAVFGSLRNPNYWASFIDHMTASILDHIEKNETAHDAMTQAIRLNTLALEGRVSREALLRIRQILDSI